MKVSKNPCVFTHSLRLAASDFTTTPPIGNTVGFSLSNLDRFNVEQWYRFNDVYGAVAIFKLSRAKPGMDFYHINFSGITKTDFLSGVRAWCDKKTTRAEVFKKIVTYIANLSEIQLSTFACSVYEDYISLMIENGEFNSRIEIEIF